MQRTGDEELRKPREILAAMDKDRVRNDSNLLTQLNAELGVSLAVEAEEVSRRNLKVATIACFVAVVALGISILQLLSPSNDEQAYEVDDSEYQKQVDTFNEQAKITSDQLARTESQLTKSEAQSERMEALILKWEEQAESQDRILRTIDTLLEVTSARVNQQAEQGGADQPATAPDSKPEGNQNPQPDSEVRPQ